MDLDYISETKRTKREPDTIIFMDLGLLSVFVFSSGDDVAILLCVTFAESRDTTNNG
jgi:hypothetical protein